MIRGGVRKPGCENRKTTTMKDVRMFLFARWLATCYADTHMDSEFRSEGDEGFNPSDAISTLNRETGVWYKEKLKHFNEVVWPNYKKNGTVLFTENFLKQKDYDNRT